MRLFFIRRVTVFAFVPMTGRIVLKYGVRMRKHVSARERLRSFRSAVAGLIVHRGRRAGRLAL